jgi:hypothetical protein
MRRFLWTFVGAAAVIAPVLAVVVLLASGTSETAARTVQPRHRTPSAHAFARDFVSVTNSYAASHHDAVRIGKADCVEPDTGYYMCSYAAQRPGAASECRLMQAHWTPKLATGMTVTVAGRVKRCASLRDALRSLP